MAAVSTKGAAELEITVAEVVDHLRIQGEFAPALAQVAERRISAAAAREQGLEVSDAELQRAADRFRVTHELYSADETNRWLEANGLTLSALERHLEADILISKLKDTLLRDSRDLLESREVRNLLRELAYRRWLDGAWE